MFVKGSERRALTVSRWSRRSVRLRTYASSFSFSHFSWFRQFSRDATGGKTYTAARIRDKQVGSNWVNSFIQMLQSRTYIGEVKLAQAKFFIQLLESRTYIGGVQLGHVKSFIQMLQQGHISVGLNWLKPNLLYSCCDEGNIKVRSIYLF